MDFNFDLQFDKHVIGVDEVGRGSWAGPVMAAAVLLKYKMPIDKRLNDSKINFEFLTASAEDIPIKTNSIDTVVCTYTLCSIPNPDIALSEISRVLKNDGRFIFTEHSKSPDVKVNRFQRSIEPLWKILGDGCHLTRDIRGLLSNSGFNIEATEDMYIPGTPKFVGYNVWGMLKK